MAAANPDFLEMIAIREPISSELGQLLKFCCDAHASRRASITTAQRSLLLTWGIQLNYLGGAILALSSTSGGMWDGIWLLSI